MTDMIEDQNEDFIRQGELEKQSLAIGQQEYWKNVEKHREDGTEELTAPVMTLIKRSVADVAAALSTQIEEHSKRAGRRHAALTLVKMLDPRIMAYHALRASLASVSGNQKLTHVSRSIGNALLSELRYGMWFEQNRHTYDMTQAHMKTTNDATRKSRIKSHMLRLEDIEGLPEWSEMQQVQVGLYILDCMMLTTGLFAVETITEGDNRSAILKASDVVKSWIDDAHQRSALFTPVRLPMVVRPVDWISPKIGGYLTDLGGRLLLIKTRNKAYLSDLANVEMPAVYSAVNAIQSTPWAINKEVLEIAERCWEQGGGIGRGMPSRNPLPLPASPCPREDLPKLRKENPTEYKQWAKKAASVYADNARLVSRRKSALDKLNIARQFADERAIYFPHQCDFRGRVYPIPEKLNPQSDDFAKGLLKFATGKPLGARGLYWLKVHVANSMDIDKVPFAERVQWVDDRRALIDCVRLDPMGMGNIWQSAPKNSWQALAAMLELSKAWASGDPESYVSHLSIPMDGSCNGLQNFSALLRDPVGGLATNLIPQDKPADIYAEVAKVVSKRVAVDAQGGHVYAAVWLGRVTRGMVKQPVMTLPYGASRAGMRGQVEAAVGEYYPGLFERADMWGACGYLANVIYDCIGTVVIAARIAMDWLQEVARIVATDGFPVRWTMPAGLPVLQEYRQYDTKPLKVHIDGARVELYLATDTTKLDKRRQSQGVSPNFVHSLDASHLMATVVLAEAAGIHSFSMIHDSFGIHAADTDALHGHLRAAFIAQYSGDLLTEFRDELCSVLPDELTELIPPIPPMGDLELSTVAGSLYFFA